MGARLNRRGRNASPCSATRIGQVMSLTRRAFGRLATASLSVTQVPAAPGIPADSFHLNIGVGTFSYHLLSLDDMIVELKANKIREIEMSRGEFILMKPTTREMV